MYVDKRKFEDRRFISIKNYHSFGMWGLKISYVK